VDALLKHNPQNPSWPDRDRFVFRRAMIDAALQHASSTGYDVHSTRSSNFASGTAARPPSERGTRRVGDNNRSARSRLRHGVAWRSPKPICSALQSSRIRVVNHFTYAIVSDGDLMEAWPRKQEPRRPFKLGKLILFVRQQSICLPALPIFSFTEDARNGSTLTVGNGISRRRQRIEAIDRALRAAREETSRPSLILLRTHIGYGSAGQARYF